MTARFGMRAFTLLSSGALAGLMAMTVPAHADSVQLTPVAKQEQKQILLKGTTTASYYWDDSSGRNGDTGLPASGKPMQKGMAASPSWPLFTEGYVVYKGKKAPFFVGDRGPGNPSNRGIMLDLDAKTFAYLLGGTFNDSSLSVEGVGGEGHAKVQYVITKWGDGVGKKNHPVAFSTGAWGRKDSNPAKPIPLVKKTEPKKDQEPEGQEPVVAAAAVPAEQPAKEATSADLKTMAVKEDANGNNWGGVLLVGGLAVLGGGAYLGRDRVRKLVRQ
ncbi:hypothetical protein [Nonomuraea sp. NPDC050310]|uniref:hypothetical protein n=1 Tax=unclassified Nonomuraea TaxID=2593643 RepID=UPI0033FEF0C3